MVMGVMISLTTGDGVRVHGNIYMPIFLCILWACIPDFFVGI